MVRYSGSWLKVNNEVNRADRTAERTVGRITNVFTTRFSVYFLTSCNFKIGVLGANYHTYGRWSRLCSKLSKCFKPRLFQTQSKLNGLTDCNESCAIMHLRKYTCQFLVPFIYVLSVITVPVAREWPLSITSTFREIGPHQLSNIKNATLMDKFMAHLIYPGGCSIHIPY